MLGFLWRSSWPIILATLVTGTVSGLGSASLIALINSALSGDFESKPMLLKFVGLCVTVLLSSSLSFYLVNRLSEKTAYELRIKISRLILSAPYPYLQK
ncbi:MAG: hypothetical protein Q7U57_11485 [Methylovulum sp.]|nr:hypothetical protein [Methylovulum sp.]